MFFKLVLVGRLENIASYRRLVEHYSLRLCVLYFLGYEADEDLPWHSTISRTRQLYPATIFEHLFDHVFAQCVAAGLVAGDTQAMDSVPVKARASLNSLRSKQPPLAPPTHLASQPSTPLAPVHHSQTAPAHQLHREAARQAKRRTEAGSLGAQHAKAKLLSNKTHYSPTDPEARIFVKPGKVRALNLPLQFGVDTAAGVISHIQADFADGRDSAHLPALVQGLRARFTANDLTLRELVADTGYSTGFNYALLEHCHIKPWIPAFGAYKPEVTGFTYAPAQDTYGCPAGKLLRFRAYRVTEDGNWSKLYRATYQDCQRCPLRATCVSGAQYKQLIGSAFDAVYRRAGHWQRARARQRMRRVRQRTVEPVFSHLLHQYGQRRVGTKGQAAAHKAMLLSAIPYNLRKLLRHQPK
ncbi:transposase [Hymenobacter sp. BRD128]|nr:transposase [Hymenobacter sp. BRD128]